MKFIIDIHLDLSMNAIEWNRDLTQSVLQINTQEKDLIDKPDRGRATVSLQAMREGNIGFCVATQIARYVKSNNPLPGWNSPAQAWAQTQGQLAWYRAMEKADEMVQIIDKKGLQNHLDLWSSSELNKPIGYLLNLEGADSIVTLDHLHRAYEQGLRAIGPAHYGPGTYAYGTDSEGGLGTKGKELLNEIEKLNMILDVTHLCDQSFWEAIDHYNGKIWASHSNCRSLVPNQRQFSNLQIKELIDRKAIIGMAFDAWMMIPKWQKGISNPKNSSLVIETIIDHIDHICQLSGNSNHIALGTDLDGGFGKEQCPYDLETISDLQKMDVLLKKRGYSENDIQKILNQNAINFLMGALP
ncbi:MAG: membrane dipeptidase [Marinoscillum sp.]|jgi:membrane dipeptidase|nr:peptidase M19 [Flavobacteriaceae bacterium]